MQPAHAKSFARTFVGPGKYKQAIRSFGTRRATNRRVKNNVKPDKISA